MPTAPTVYEPPDPRDIPEWRARVRDFLETNVSLIGLTGALDQGKAAMVPLVPSLGDHSVGAVAAPILSTLEHKRLTEATLYYCDSDMTSLALAAAETPPREKFSFDRMPSEAGFMVFSEPIGGYTQPLTEAIPGWELASPDLKVTTPIVAVSWSRWNPAMYRIEEGHPVRWFANSIDGLMPISDDFDGVWFTFWSSSKTRWSALPPDEPVFYDHGRVVRARELEALGIDGTNPVQWDNELVIREGTDLSNPPGPDTTDQWGHVIYRAWQLAQQKSSGGRLTETEHVPRIRAGRRRDQRTGITGPSEVRLIHLHSSQRPSREASEQDAQQSSGVREPNWTCRWPVKPHTRMVCQNPHGHASGDCEHIERIIPWHIKGPADKPLKSTNTVHVWNTPDE